ncbi:hypothetical protein GCM10020331_018500 [Ectobacillus funiculus]
MYDKQEQLLWLITHYDTEQDAARKYLEELKAMWTQEIPTVFNEIENVSDEEATVSFTEEGFIDAAKRVQEYIAAGDVFQVNLSVRQSQPLSSHPMEIYTSLREINPSPYMGYLELSDFQIVSGSPELLIKKRQGWRLVQDLLQEPVHAVRMRLRMRPWQEN